MIEQALSEILTDRAPVGAEAAHLDHLAAIIGLKDWRPSGVGHLKVGPAAARWWVAVGIDEPTLLLSGEGTDQAWGFASYGMPKDAALLRQCELRHQGGQLLRALDPESGSATALRLYPTQAHAPVGATWAIWPNPCELHGSRLIGPGAGGRLLTAATLAALGSGQSSLGAIFVRMSRFSANCLTDLLLTTEVSRVIWLAAVPGKDSELGGGAYHLRSPALPGDQDLERLPGGPAARFVDREALPPYALDIRRGGCAEFGLGLVVTHIGGPRETADVRDGEAVTKRLIEIAAMG